MAESGRLHIVRNGREIRETGPLVAGDPEPSEPFRFAVAGPQGTVATPEAPHLVLPLPFVNGRLHGRREIRRHRRGLTVQQLIVTILTIDIMSHRLVRVNGGAP